MVETISKGSAKAAKAAPANDESTASSKPAAKKAGVFSFAGSNDDFKDQMVQAAKFGCTVAAAIAPVLVVVMVVDVAGSLLGRRS